MRVFGAQADVDFAVAAIAGRQYGVVTRAQLVAIGLGRGAIERRLRSGRLHPLHHGVYAVGHVAPHRRAGWLAAVLACGDGAVLSHRSAASLWRIRDGQAFQPDVTVATRNGRRGHPGIVIHRSPLEPGERRVHLRIPVTSLTRTSIDLEHEVDDDDLVHALREVRFQRRLYLREAQTILNRRPSRRIKALLKHLILVQNELEARLAKLCDRHGLPRPLTQQAVEAKRVDFFWPDQRLIVETDGWEGHGTRTAFQADRATSNAFQLAGYTILRFTHEDLEDRPAYVASQIRAALERPFRAARPS
jgi:very-short-patch-repair endonuclease